MCDDLLYVDTDVSGRQQEVSSRLRHSSPTLVATKVLEVASLDLLLLNEDGQGTGSVTLCTVPYDHELWNEVLCKRHPMRTSDAICATTTTTL